MNTFEKYANKRFFIVESFLKKKFQLHMEKMYKIFVLMNKAIGCKWKLTVTYLNNLTTDIK